VLDIDTADDDLDPAGEFGDAVAADDEAVDDPDAEPVEALL
jgi:hypothetical protein